MEDTLKRYKIITMRHLFTLILIFTIHTIFAQKNLITTDNYYDL